MSQGSLQDSWNMNRREFMKGAAIATAGALIGSENKTQASDQPVRPTSASQAEVGRVPQKPLGKTGINVSALGVGGYHLGTAKSQQEATEIVARALDAGVNFFDNAWEYYEGESETRLGNALQGKRDQAILMTKVCTHGRGKEVGLRMLEESLRRLKTDHLDVWQIHEVVYYNDPDLVFCTGRRGRSTVIG